MSRKVLISKGGVYIFFYVIMCAISNVFVNHTTRTIDPVVTLFYTSIFTIVFFLVLNLGELTSNIVLIKKNKKSILWLNLLNAIIWFVIFFSLKVLSPSVFACLFLGAIPINLFVIELKKSNVSNKKNVITALFLLIIFLLMLFLVSYDMGGNNSIQILKYGTLVTVVGGMVAAFVMKISKELAVKNLSASMVVSLRFYGLLVISFIMGILNPTQLLIGSTALIELLVLALTSMALPLFLLQKALKTLSPLYASIMITTIPILTYLFQLVTGYYLFSVVKFGITIVFSIVLIILTHLKKKDKTE